MNGDGSAANGVAEGAAAQAAAPTPVRIQRKAGLLDTLAQRFSVQEAAQPTTATESRKSWALDVPALSAADLDIIKLTAQYVARNGRSFQMGLMNREARNPQFGFLQPGHPYNPFYNKLVESYTAVLLPSREMIEQLHALRLDKEGLIRRVVSRALAQRVLVKTEAQRQAAEEAEREAMSAIDWNDFIVVETIAFSDVEALPPPPDKQRLISGTLSRTQDNVDDSEVTRHAQFAHPGQSASAAPSTTAPVVDSSMVSPEEISGPTRIVSAGVAAASRRNTSALKTTICPKCNQPIPVEEFAEHMKIELSGAGQILHGPAGSGRRVETNRGPGIDNPYEEGDMISMNLARLAAKRTDIFGEEDEAATQAKQRAEEERLKKLRESKSWDGHASSVEKMTAASAAAIAAAGNAGAFGGPAMQRGPMGPQLAPMMGQIPPRPPIPGMPYPGVPVMMMPQYQQPMPMMYPSGGMYAPHGYHHGAPYVPAGPVIQTEDVGSGGMKRAADSSLEEPPAKRAKGEQPDAVLVPETDWLAKLGGADHIIKLTVVNQISAPEAAAEVEIEIAVGQLVASLKSEINQRLSIPVNKQNLRVGPAGAFLKDKSTLAAHNLESGMQIILLPKERGGKKK